MNEVLGKVKDVALPLIEKAKVKTNDLMEKLAPICGGKDKLKIIISAIGVILVAAIILSIVLCAGGRAYEIDDIMGKWHSTDAQQVLDISAMKTVLFDYDSGVRKTYSDMEISRAKLEISGAGVFEIIEEDDVLKLVCIETGNVLKGTEFTFAYDTFTADMLEGKWNNIFSGELISVDESGNMEIIDEKGDTLYTSLSFGYIADDRLYMHGAGVYTYSDNDGVRLLKTDDGEFVHADSYNAYCDKMAAENPDFFVYESDHIKINALCVDDSYIDEDNPELKMLYLFYTYKAGETDGSIDSKYTEIIIGGNSYSSDNYANSASAADYALSYYYSSYIESVYTGSSLDVIATFMVPASVIDGAKIITFADSQIEGISKIRVSGDIIAHYENGAQMAKAVDPEGYAAEMTKRELADSSTAKKVRNYINGHYWTCYVNYTTYRIEFEGNKFKVSTSLGISNSGTYSVRKGYIFCTYSSNNYTVMIPYTIENGEIDLDVVEAFDVN